MAIAVLLIVLGLVLLVGGGELLVRGATGLARLAGVTPSVIGLTIVAAGTSMPELVVSIDAALSGSPDLAVGNVVGSNIFNIGAILGIAALIAPLRIEGNTVRLEWPVMLLACCLLHMFVRDGALDRLEGGFFALGLIVFIAYTVRIARRDVTPREADELDAAAGRPIGEGGARMWSMSIGAIVAGCALLAGGAHLLVQGAVTVAAGLGVSETVIGLTIVAAGTSAPELATSAVAAYRGRDDIAVANVIGSSIFNVLCIMGVTGMIRPVPVDEQIVRQDNWWMIGFTVLLLPLMRTGLRITRAEGGVLLAAFAAYMVVLLGT